MRCEAGQGGVSDALDCNQQLSGAEGQGMGRCDRQREQWVEEAEELYRKAVAVAQERGTERGADADKGVEMPGEEGLLLYRYEGMRA